MGRSVPHIVETETDLGITIRAVAEDGTILAEGHVLKARVCWPTRRRQVRAAVLAKGKEKLIQK